MKLKSFQNFSINESFSEYVQIEGITNETELFKNIAENATPAFENFCQRYKIPIDNPEIKVYQNKNSHYISLKSDNVDSSNFGIFQKVMEKVNFSFFSGREIKYDTNNNDQFVVNPFIWTTLNLSWESLSGGSNGSDYFYNIDFHIDGYAKRNDLFYNIPAKKWESFVEHHADTLGALINKKLHDQNKKHGTFE